MSHQAQTPAVRSRPTALLLDLGGVVLDIDPSGCFDSWAKAADTEVAAIAARWAVDDAYKAFEVGAIDFGEYIESLSPRLGITLTRAQWCAGWNELLRGPFTDVVQILPDIAIPLYAFSNTNPVHQAVWQIQLADCLVHFRKVFTSWEIGLRKPDVESYLRVAEDMRVPPADILFVDDNRENVAGARSAGLDARHTTGPSQTVAILRESMRHV